MFCLFKNSHINPALNRYVILVSWLGVVAWLYFAFVEKELVMKLFEGQAIMVDLLLGIPLVLMLAVVVYATIYWFIKLLIIYLLPHAVVPADQGELPDSLEDQAKLEEEFGQEYWRQIDESNKESMPDNSAPSMPVIEPDAEQKKDSHKSVESEESVQTLTNQHKS